MTDEGVLLGRAELERAFGRSMQHYRSAGISIPTRNFRRERSAFYANCFRDWISFGQYGQYEVAIPIHSTYHK
jgi:hypothetical protein